MKKLLIIFLGVMLVLTLLACAETGAFEVNFIVDGEIYQTIEANVDEAIVLPQNPTKEGQAFDGWYCDEGVWEKPFTADTLIDDQTSEDINVYSKWVEKVGEKKAANVDITSSLLTISEKTATATFSNSTTTFSFFDDIKVANGASYTLATDIGCQNPIVSKTVALSEGNNTYYILVTNEHTQKLYTVTIYRLPMCTVEFNTYGGTTFEAIRLEEGSVLESMDDAYKTGYVFNGWTSNGEVVAFPYTVTCNTTLDAEYTVIKYDIVYHLNGGKNNENNVANYTAEQELTLENPKRDGYAFLGWFTEATFENRAEKIDLGSTDNKEFYAKWQACENMLTFDGNGATDGSMADMIICTDETEALSNNKFVKKGYTFKGWATSPDGKVVYTDGASYTAKKNGAQTLYAVWTANNNFLMFNSNGGLGNMTIMTIDTDSTKSLLLNRFTKLGYTFKGWSTTPGGAVEYVDGDTYTMGTDSTNTLYAVWRANSHTLVFDSNGGVGNMKLMTISTDSSKDLISNSFTKFGYTFKGWSTTPDGEVEYTDGASYTMYADGACTLYAVWEVIYNNLSFESNGGSGTTSDMKIAVSASVALTKNGFDKPGYTFKGWSTSLDGEVEYMDCATYVMGTSSSYTLFAIWEANNNTLTLDANGGCGAAYAVTIATDSNIVLTSNSFTKPGYTFKGWSTSSNGAVEYQDCDTYTMGTNSSYTLYAVWEINNNTLSFDSNGGSGNMADMIIATNSNENLISNGYIKPGYTFMGWSTSPDGEVEYIDCDTYTMGTNSSYTLYAVWEVNNNTLSFDSNGGSGDMPTMTMATNSSKKLLSNSFYKPGYTFRGWSTSPNGGVEYANCDSYTMGTNSSYTLYAVWEANNNVLMFSSNGGSGYMADMIIATGSSVTLTSNTFSGLGGTFIGWSTTPDGEVEYADGAVYTMGTNSTNVLYAVWRYKSYVQLC